MANEYPIIPEDVMIQEEIFKSKYPRIIVEYNGSIYQNWTVEKLQEKGIPDDVILDGLKKVRKQYIKQKFIESFNNGYTCSNGITMDCKLEDIDKLDKGYRLAQKLNQTQMLIRDFNNQEHTLQLADIDQMLTELGLNYQQQWQKKINLQKQVEEAMSIDDIMSIDWS